MPTYQQVLDILREKEGFSEEQLIKFSEDVSKVAMVKLQTEMLNALTEEDLAEIDKCGSQEEANIEIRMRFAERTGKNPDKVMQEFLDNFAQGFLEKYQSEKVKEQTSSKA